MLPPSSAAWTSVFPIDGELETSLPMAPACRDPELRPLQADQDCDSAGTASIVLDGVTHDLDVVSTCAIDGSIIDFFGQSSESDVAVVVTGGGSEILLADEEGQQTMTRDIVFAIAGQQATCTGSLAGNRQATVSIGCG